MDATSQIEKAAIDVPLRLGDRHQIALAGSKQPA